MKRLSGSHSFWDAIGTLGDSGMISKDIEMTAPDISTMAEDIGYMAIYDEFQDNDVLGVNERMKLIRSHLPASGITSFNAGNAMSLFNALEQSRKDNRVIFYNLEDETESDKRGFIVMFPNTETDLAFHYKLAFGVSAS